MKTMKKYIVPILLCYAFAVFPSCNEQEKTTQQNENKKTSIGTDATGLDIKANVIYQDKKDNYWFVSKEKGLYKFDGQTLSHFTLQDGLCSYTIISVQEDRFGNIYFDTPDGICKYDGHKFTVLAVAENSLSKNEWKSGPDDLWFSKGWNNNGPYRYDGKNLYQLAFPKNSIEDAYYKKNPNVSYNPYGIFSMYNDSHGNMWFGTADMGIYRFDGKKISWMYERHLTETPEGGAFCIRSITEDKDGYFWICNSNFKYKILPDNVKGMEPIPINYKREKGTMNDTGGTQYFMSMITDNDGVMWMTNQAGVWRNDGNVLTPFLIDFGERKILPTSIYSDNRGVLWLGTNTDGIYKYDGKSFEKFKIKENYK